jgi:hypothetical protein
MAAHSVRIDVYSHHIRLSEFNWEMKEALNEFLRKKLSQWGPVRGFGGRIVAEIKSVFVGVWKNRRTYYFLRAQQEEIQTWLEGYGFHRDRHLIVEHEIYEPDQEVFIKKTDKIARDYQNDIFKFALEDGRKTVHVGLQTGKGKSFISMTIVMERGFRSMYILKPGYIPKWIEDMNEFYDFKAGDVLVIKGAQSLKRLINLAKAGDLKAKVILMGNATLRNFLDEFEYLSGEENSYFTDFENLMEILGIGTLVFDEIHQDIHFNYRVFSYAHVPYILTMSATLDTDNGLVNDRTKAMLPASTHAPLPPYDKYIAVQSLLFEMNSLDGIRTKNFFGMFNHNLFEESIMKDKTRLSNYKNMVTEIIRFDYINKCPADTPMLVFFASIEMCTIMAKHLAMMFPEKKVNRYIGEDDYQDLLKADIAVTTLRSAGTAVDIPNLSYVLMTVFVSSRQANVQGLGRLRRLKDHPDWTPNFAYLTCRNIDKSMLYMEEKLIKFDGKVTAHAVLQTPYRI